MANCCLLFVAESVPRAKRKLPPCLGVGQFAWDIPIIFRALLSPDPQAARSMIFNAAPRLAVAGDRAAGVARLQWLLDTLGPDHPRSANIQEAISFLVQPHVAAFPVFVLEPFEILDLDGRPLETCLDLLVEELRTLTPDKLLEEANKPVPKERRGDGWSTAYWGHALNFSPRNEVPAPFDIGRSYLSGDPDYFIEHADKLAACRKVDWVGLKLSQGSGAADAAIDALAAIPNRFRLKLDGRMAQLPDSVARLPNLMGLTLIQLGLTSLPASMASADQLEQLIIKQNNLDHWPALLQSTRSLRRLDLSGNPLRSNADGSIVLNDLEELLLDDCGLEQVPDWVLSLKRLRELYIGQNPKLTQLPEGICALRQLQTLSVGQCSLETVPACVGDMPELQTLNLSSNKLTTVPPSIKRAPLEILSLGGNPMRRPLLSWFLFKAKRVNWRVWH